MINRHNVEGSFQGYLQRNGEYPVPRIRICDPEALALYKNAPLGFESGPASLYLMGEISGKGDLEMLKLKFCQAHNYAGLASMGFELHKAARNNRGFVARLKRKFGNAVYFRYINKLYRMLEKSESPYSDQENHEAVEAFAKIRKWQPDMPVKGFVRKQADIILERRLPAYLFKH